MAVKEGYKHTEVGVIPEDWEVTTIGQLGIFSKGQGIRKDEALSGCIPCVRYGEIYTIHNDYIKRFGSFISEEVAKTSKLLKQGDILFAGSGETKEEIGKNVAFIDHFEAYVGGDVIVLSPKYGNSLFYGYLFNLPVVARQKSSRGQGDAVVHISASNLSNIKIPLPPLPEQKAIATALSDMDGLINSLSKLIEKKKNIKQGAMQELLTGKKRLEEFSGEWVEVKLGDIVNYKNGQSYESLIVENGRYNLITLDSIDINGKLKVKHRTVNIAYDYICKNDIIMILSDVAHGYFLGLTAVIEENNKYVLNQRVGLLRLKTDVSPYFISNLINVSQKYFYKQGQGSSQKNLSKNNVLNMQILIPPTIEEQKAIATILSDMDTEIEKLQAKLDKYKAIKQGMMQELLTGRIRLLEGA